MGPWWLTWHLCLYICEKCEMSRLWRTDSGKVGQYSVWAESAIKYYHDHTWIWLWRCFAECAYHSSFIRSWGGEAKKLIETWNIDPLKNWTEALVKQTSGLQFDFRPNKKYCCLLPSRLQDLLVLNGILGVYTILYNSINTFWILVGNAFGHLWQMWWKIVCIFFLTWRAPDPKMGITVENVKSILFSCTRGCLVDQAFFRYYFHFKPFRIEFWTPKTCCDGNSR